MRSLILLVLLACAVPAPAAVVYVKAGGSGDGSSWAQARGSLGAALAAATAGDQVWLGQGTWKPGSARTDTFLVPPGVSLYGGFLGGETSPAQRPGDPSLTVLSGEIGGAGAGDNVERLLTLSGADGGGTRRVDGLTISGAYGDCGLYAWQFGDLTISRVRFLGNSSTSLVGGLRLVAGGALTVEDCRFEGNQGPVSACYLSGAAAVAWSRTLVVGNGLSGASPSAHVLIRDAASVTVESCLFSANTGRNSLVADGAPALRLINNPATLANCLVAGNEAGGVASDGALTVSACTLAGNLAADVLTGANLVTRTQVPLPAIAIRTSILAAPYQLSLLPAADQANWLVEVAGDPGFLDPAHPAGADGLWLTADDGYQLSATAAALEQSLLAVPGADPAMPAADLYGVPRPQGRKPDPGCFERAMPGGRAPVATGAAVVADEDVPLVPFTLAGSDADGDPLTMIVVLMPPLGELLPTLDGTTPSGPAIPVTAYPWTVPGGGRTVLYRPPPDYSFYSFPVVYAVLNDGFQDSEVATLRLTLNPVNDPPTITAPAAVGMLEDQGALTVVATGIADGPLEGGQVTITARSDAPALIPDPAVSYVTYAATAAVVLAPLPDANGSATITLTVLDGHGGSATAAFTVNVHPINDPPFFTMFPRETVAEDSGELQVQLFGLSAGPADEAGQTLTVLATPVDAALVEVLGIERPAPDRAVLRLRPRADATGSTQVVVSVFDDGLTQNGGIDATAQVLTVSVTPVNDPPALATGTLAVAAGGSATVAAGALAVGDADLPPDTSLVCTLAAAPAVGDLLLAGVPLAAGATFTRADLLAGRLVYRHRAGAADAFAVTASDGIAPPVGPATVVVAVAGADGPPVVTTTVVATLAGLARPFTLAASAVPGRTLAWSLGAQPAKAAVVLDDPARGRCRLLPAAGALGDDSFTVTVDDGVLPPVSAAIALRITGLDEERPQPAGDPLRAVEAGASVRLEVPWDVGGLSAPGALEFAITGEAPPGLALSVLGPDRVLVQWREPEDSPPGWHRRFGLLAAEPRTPAAGHLPFTVVVMRPLRGAN
ncbi:MAG: Ig-like domain-containing protein [Planctomycetes bacterium]|nr:Ig-like domain-containing protein [Planctomycetota bacterium]